MMPRFCALVAALLTAPTAFAQAVHLADSVKAGDCFRYQITLNVAGKLKVERDGKPDPIPLKATASHAFVERIAATDALGGIGRALRHYSAAGSEGEVGSERRRRELAADRRLIVAQRAAVGSLHFSPDGPLTREELELVAEHFDTLCVPALVPGTDLKPGETWTLRPETTQAACLFEGLIKSELTGKLTEVKDGVAFFTITGTAEGVEAGAIAKVTVSATGKYDIAAKRVTELTWTQTDDRGQGPASPATEVKATITLKRTPLGAEPKELGEAARAKVPADGAVPERLTLLRYADPTGRYQFVYPRDWHIVGRTKEHLVLRLLDNGEFVAQVTLTSWKKAAPGQHASPEEFKKILAQLPGWAPDEILGDGVVPATAGRWLYRVAAKGKQDGLDVVQTFYLLAAPDGGQMAATVLARQEKAAKLGTRDLALVNAIELKQ
jgi:hypothetical protein